ncbi:alpha/beta fold hydrolase [Micromonospora sp. NPDC007271]|uniref:alpha/beta hydrolase n=1 Tax=Micromonospora sp. NPDC007271 TaxID=3154587 RepID=UPI0033CB69F4
MQTLTSDEPVLTNPASVPRCRRWRVIAAAAAALALAGAAVLATALGAQQRGGVPHREVVLDGRIPATVYVPGRVPGLTASAVDLPPPVADRLPPAVVLAHGHSADRSTMSWLARRIARAGYVVVTFDFRGHGGNRTPHEPHGFDGRRDDLRTVYDWTAALPYVDSQRIVVAGHSMGAAAVVDFATQDARPAATVALGGSVATVVGSVRPRNPLFLVAAWDGQVVRDEAAATAGEFLGRTVPFGGRYGNHADGSAVGLLEVAGADHVTMLYADDSARLIVDWLRASVGPGTTVATPTDHRLALAGGYLLCVAVLLVLLGAWAGRLAGPAEAPEPAGRWAFALVAAATVAPLPLLSWGDPGQLLGLEAGGALVVLLAAAGLLLLALRRSPAARRRLRLPQPRPVGPAGVARLLVPGAVAVGGVLLLLGPLGPVAHTFVPTPPRIVAALASALLLLPFFAGLEELLRHGSPAAAAARSLAARLVVLAVVMAGVVLGVLPGMLGIYLLVLVPLFVLLELVAAGVYATSRDHRLSALAQSAVIGWMLALLSPTFW